MPRKAGVAPLADDTGHGNIHARHRYDVGMPDPHANSLILGLLFHHVHPGAREHGGMGGKGRGERVGSRRSRSQQRSGVNLKARARLFLRVRTVDRTAEGNAVMPVRLDSLQSVERLAEDRSLACHRVDDAQRIVMKWARLRSARFLLRSGPITGGGTLHSLCVFLM